MDFYLQLLEEHYDFLLSQHERSINQAAELEEKCESSIFDVCPCGLVYVDECRGCPDGKIFVQEQLPQLLRKAG